MTASIWNPTSTIFFNDTHANVLDFILDDAVKTAVIAGTNTTDLYAYLQAALDWLRVDNRTLEFFSATYLCNSRLTLLRAEAADSKRWKIIGNNALIDWSGSGLTSGVALKVGAIDFSLFVEEGAIIIEDLGGLGPEPLAPGDEASTPSTTLVGIEFYCAGQVYHSNLQFSAFYTGCHTHACFPLLGVKPNFRRNYIALHNDETSNLHVYIEPILQESRYPHLIKATTFSFDSGKINSISCWHPHWEGSVCGLHIDTGSAGSGQALIRDIEITHPYIAGLDYDFVRLCVAWTFATPSVRGANCTDQLNNFSISNGMWNPTGGVWSATQAAICYDTVGRVRDVQINIPVVSKEVDSDVFVNAPRGGVVRTSAYAGISDGIITEYLYSNSMTIVRRLNPNGSIMIGAGKVNSATISETGLDAREDGSLWQTVVNDVVHRLNRITTAGTLVAKYYASVLIGATNVDANGVTEVLDSVNNVLIRSGAGSPEGTVVAGVGSIYLRTNGASLTGVYFKLTGTGSTGWFAALAHLIGSVAYDPGNLVDGAGVTTIVTVTGAALGDVCAASYSLDLQGITLTSYVSATDTVSVRFQNETTGAIDLASGTLKAVVFK